MIRLRHKLAHGVARGMLAFLASACSGPAPGTKADATPMGDVDSGFIGGEIDSGIGLLFVPVPAFGDTFENDGKETKEGGGNTISVRSAAFTLVDLRLIGDAASGDSRTSKDVVELAWNKGVSEPIPVGYENAPAGMYSRVRGTVVRFVITGDVELEGGEEAAYEAAQDSVSLPVEFSLDLNLDPGEGKTLTVEIDLKAITEEIAFEDLPIEEGTIKISPGSEAMDTIEEKIESSFNVAE